MDTAALAFLEKTQQADGGWSYAPRQAATVEATAAVALATHGEPIAAAVNRAAMAWLVATQHEDGGWGMSRNDAESAWPTAWAVLALHRADAAAAERGSQWLAQVPVIRITGDELQAEFRRKLAVDPNLHGWPWLAGEASWIEPTALALLALAAVGGRRATERMAEAARFIADRRCRDGGWNFGNPIMLGGVLPARAHPTAWALLALAAVAPGLIRPADITALRAEAAREGSSSALALALLALHTLGETDLALAGRLAGRRAADGGWDTNPYHTALALLADRGRLI